MTIKTYCDCDKSALSIASEEGGSGLSGRAERDGAWPTTIIAVDSRLLTLRRVETLQGASEPCLNEKAMLE
jgi:hypothetical protein